MIDTRVGRNAPCPCGSGKKFKKCCLLRQTNGAPPANGIALPPQPGPRSSQQLPEPVSPTFWSHPPGRPDAPPPAGGEWVEYVFVKGKGWTHQNELKPGDQYQLKDGGWRTHQPEKIEATGNHPFWVESGEDLDLRPVPECCPAEVPGAAIKGRWVAARDLRVGDILFTRDGRRVPVTNLSSRHVQMKVYNLHVEGLNNYAVGQAGILVHNKNGPQRIFGMREWEVAPGQQAKAAKTLQQLEADYVKATRGRRPIVLDADHPQGALGYIDPRDGQVYLYSGERFGSAARAEELFHYQQLKARGLLGKTEAQIGPKVIQEIEQEVEGMLRNAGFQPRR